MQSDKTCPIVGQYLAYLITIKGRSQNTILEYRLDLMQFFRFVAGCRGIECPDFQFANIELGKAENRAERSPLAHVIDQHKTTLLTTDRINYLGRVDTNAELQQ